MQSDRCVAETLPKFRTKRGENYSSPSREINCLPLDAKSLPPLRLGVAMVCRFKFSANIVESCTASYGLTDAPRCWALHPERVDMHLKFLPSDGLADPGGQFDAAPDPLIRGLSRS